MDIDYLKKTGVRLVIGLVVSFFLLLSDGMGWTQSVYSFGNYIAEPVVFWTNEFGMWVQNTAATISQIGSLRSENARLSMEVADLTSELGKLSEVEIENEALRTQLGIKLTKEWTLERVRILGLDERGVSEFVLIDGGRDQGIEVGDVVIYGDILVGEVREVFRSTARVRLVSNQSSNIAVVDQRTRAKGLVRGSLEGIVMEEVLENEQLEEGDIVITWEDDIPGGLVVGLIIDVEEVPTSATKRGFIEQGFSLEDLQYVFVVTDY